MKQLKDISLQTFTLVTVETEKEADLVFNERDSIADFVSLGTICLYKSITGDTDTTVKIAKADFSKMESGMTAYVNNKVIPVPLDAFVSAACDCSEAITDYITEKKSANNMMLGLMVSQALSMYMLGEDIGMGTEPHLKSMLRGILPLEWDMTDTIEAQRVAFTLFQKMFEVVVAPFEV